MKLTAGSTIDGRFEVVSLIGEGGMGLVYEVRDKALDRTVAMKVLCTTSAMSEQQVGRFRREAQILDTLRHPGIVEVFNSGITEDGSPYIAMEFVDGAPLNHMIETTGGLEYRKALRLFIQICDALEFAHAQDVVHRDIKPGNLLVFDSGSGLAVKIIDFGVAKFLTDAGQSLTQTGSLVGSVHYMSPEQLTSRPVDKRADIYALGCTLFETISGKRAFDGETYFGTVQAHLNNEPPTLSAVRPDLEVPLSLDLVLRKMMAVDPAQRYQDCSEVKDALHRILNGQAVSTSEFVPRAKAHRSFRLQSLSKELWMVVGAGIILIVPFAILMSDQLAALKPAAKLEQPYWQLAKTAEKEKRFPEALTNINKALESAQTGGDQAEVTFMYVERARIYHKWAHENVEKGERPADGVHLQYLENAVTDAGTAVGVSKAAQLQASPGLKKEVYALACLRATLQLSRSLNSVRRSRESSKHFDEVIALVDESQNRATPEDMKEAGLYINRCIERAIKNGHEKESLGLMAKEINFLKRHWPDGRLELVGQENATLMRIEFGDQAADSVLALYSADAK